MATGRSRSTRKPVNFTHIEIGNWRNFVQADVALERRVFLIGPNASGKSNFLDIFRFLHDIAVVGGGFQDAVARREGVSALRSLAARRYSDISITVSLKLEQTPDAPSWRYELTFNQDNLRRPIIKREAVSLNDDFLFVRPNAEDEADAERLTQTWLEQVNVNKEFRELADAFSSVRYLHLVPQLVREPDRSVGRVNDPFGGDFLEQVARQPENTRSARLRRIRQALSVAVPQLTDIELFRDARGAPHIRGKYAHWRPKRAWQNENQFSDGTLRLIGMLWATLEGSGPLLLEEPELSLHPEVVRYLPEMFHRLQRRTQRQILLSSHSSELLQSKSVGLDEVLLLEPSSEGTKIRRASSLSDAPQLLEHGLSLADIVLPRTSPKNAEQLTLFGDW